MTRNKCLRILTGLDTYGLSEGNMASGGSGTDPEVSSQVTARVSARCEAKELRNCITDHINEAKKKRRNLKERTDKLTATLKNAVE